MTRSRIARSGYFVALALVVIWAVVGADHPWPTLFWTGSIAVALGVGPRLPFPAVAASLIGITTFEHFLGSGVENSFLIFLMVGCFLGGRFGSLRGQPFVGAIVLLFVLRNIFDPDGADTVADTVFPILLTAGPWLLGLALKLASRRAETAVLHATLLESIHTTAVRSAEADERLRIARDIHDIVAHNLSAISLQAQVARREAEAQRPVTTETLREIERAARNAMADVRRLLGVLRVDGEMNLEPTPGLDQIDNLFEANSKLGCRIEVTEEGGRRPMPLALSQTAYRILQEALTNARRHGSGEILVKLRWGAESFIVHVSNPCTKTVGQSGHGLAGIAERAEMFGGVVHAARDDAVWNLVVELPVPARLAP